MASTGHASYEMAVRGVVRGGERGYCVSLGYLNGSKFFTSPLCVPSPLRTLTDHK